MFFSVIFPVVLIIIGLILVIGTKLDWYVLTDPPEDWLWPQSMVKRVYGTEFLIYYNYFGGLLFLLLGFFFLLG